MNRTLRAIIGVMLVGIIMFSAISICQNLGGALRADITEQKLYTLSRGTKAILGRLNQPITIKLFYAKTAALKGPDQIKYYNDYYYFVRALLTEYERAADGKVILEVIDPRPFSDEEEQALRYGLQAFPITREENFFFGLVVQTQFGVTRSISFFQPDRQNFVEYDITSEIDAAITRQKQRIGVLSSLGVMGDDMSDYMVQMMMQQGQRPQPPWTIISQLKQKYEVVAIDTQVEEIADAEGEKVDFLLVIHPKNLPEKTLWAIDQFILAGGRTIIFVDPHAIMDRPTPQQRMMGQAPQTHSELNQLLRTWHLEMPLETYAGDRSLALEAPVGPDRHMEKIIAYMELKPGCFNSEHVVSSELNQILMTFPGVLREIGAAQTTDKSAEKTEAEQNQAKIELIPLIHTTAGGNSWMAAEFEVTQMPPEYLNNKFQDGAQAVNLGYLAAGHFMSSFPDGIEIVEGIDEPDDPAAQQEPQKTTETRKLTGLTQGQDCAVAVFADVDMLADGIAFQSSLFGMMVVNDNSALLMNTIEALSGSGDLIAIRSRGNYKRPFTLVDQIEAEAEQETAAEEAMINAEIEGFQQELQKIVSEARSRGETLIDASELTQAQADLNLKIKLAQRRLKEVQRHRIERIEQLRDKLRNLCMLAAPLIILLVAIALSMRRSLLRRRYISHASDA
ncbi:MAG: hypothetical protein AMJ79_07690 [Phycisphaerae bacterium SM23_30]|nr:MAG: hypothetical protein AMJ79_07690 [Phycisphaerae bacterium SM23_30]